MTPLDLPALFHVGWVVRDCDAAQDELASRLGAGPFVHVGDATGVSRFDQALVHGRPSPFALKIAFGTLGGVVFELLEPLDDRSPHAEFLAERGEGLHHVAFLVTDFDDQLEAARSASPAMELLVDGTGPGNPVRWVYFDGGGARSTVVELIERTALAESLFRDVLALGDHGLGAGR